MADVRDIGVVGAGFMGSGIAESAARAGLRVRVYEPARRRSSSRARGSPRPSSARSAAASSTPRRPRRSRSGSPTPPSCDSLHGSELVIEAIVEDLEVKRDMFRTLDGALDDS